MSFNWCNLNAKKMNACILLIKVGCLILVRADFEYSFEFVADYEYSEFIFVVCFVSDVNGITLQVLPNPLQQENGFRQGQIEIKRNSIGIATASLNIPAIAINKSRSKLDRW